MDFCIVIMKVLNNQCHLVKQNLQLQNRFRIGRDRFLFLQKTLQMLQKAIDSEAKMCGRFR